MPHVARPILLALVLIAVLSPAASAKVERTGRYLVSFERKSTARPGSLLGEVLRDSGARRAGDGVPELGVATVKGSAQAIADLRRDPAVKSVSVEYRREFRRTPNDPALGGQEPGAPAGTVPQWWLRRQSFPSLWDVTTGSGALVGVIDSGIDGAHPELRGKVASAVELGTGAGAFTDQDGHGTHVSGLACANTDEGRGVAGAGWGCRIVLVKAPLLRDEDIADGIRIAVDRGARAINMSFGGGPGTAVLSQAIDYAVQRNVVLVASASNNQVANQGAPASELQPNDAPNIDAGRGLVVTAADFSDRNAATGNGAQISLAAYGFYDGIPPYGGSPGLISTYPGNGTERTEGFFNCGCRASLGGDPRYARLEGTSMAAPQVTALAALIGHLNPVLTVREKLRIIKATARGRGSWNPSLGFGIIDAGRAVDVARRVDRRAPESRLRATRRARLRGRSGRARIRLRWRGKDPVGRPGLIASGVRSYDVFVKRGRGRYRRIRRATRRRTTVVKLRRGTYRFYTRDRDRAGNLEPKPRRADARVVVR
ncbi:MAG: S8 family serine peptidase [Actinomycetota bacterium]|nr:S8 family serine peptidase [Actinomycetota bacterium]